MDYRTEDGSANAGSDYQYSEGTLVFKPGETRKEIKVSEGRALRSFSRLTFDLTVEHKNRITPQLLPLMPH